ncbi:MAG: hypothetical protein HY741_20785 [Chloroflexi bacterium]|nr:hypothetical protein [Chloroflexota bacterium]
MRRKKVFSLFVLCGIAVGVTLLLAACGGISQSEYDATKAQLAAQDQKVAALQQQLSDKEKQIADLQKAPASKQFTGVVWEPKPTWTPKPPPTAAPADFTPPAKRAMPESYTEPVGAYTVYVETLISGKHPSKYGLEPSVGCVVSGVFKRGTKIVWRFELVDTTTGKRLTDKDGATVKIKIPGADDLTGRFSQRAGGAGMPDAPWMWATGWDIPPDYPIGALDYSIVVTNKDGKTFTWKTPALIQSTQGGIDSRVQIID